VALCLLAQVAAGQTVAVQVAPQQTIRPTLPVLANHIPNRYTLTFRPSSNEPGFHAIQVQVIHQPAPVTVTARESYWATSQTDLSPK
jgi:hypothetical protein